MSLALLQATNELGAGLEFAILVGLILVSGFLAGAEIAIVSVRATRLEELIEDGSESAKSVQRLRSNPERFLATVQIGITAVGVVTSLFAGVSFSGYLEQYVAQVELFAESANEISLALVVVLVTYLQLVLGELVPKSLALRTSERYALVVSRPLLWLAWISRPLVWLLTVSSNAVLRVFGDHTSFIESKLSLQEVRSLVDRASEGGGVDPEAGEIAARALEFGELSVSDVMVHRRYVEALSVDADETRVRAAILEAGHRRMPVFEGSIDNVLGYLSWRDVITRLWAKEPIVVRELVRPALFVPDTTPAIDLLKDLQRRRVQIAIAVDEHGGMAGIVTLEDLLEELVGEIVSEHDQEPEPILRQTDGSVLVQGTTTLRDLNRELETEIEEPDDASTIAGLCVQLAGERLPRAGQEFMAEDGSRIVVVDVSPRRVRQVRIWPKIHSPESDD